MDCSYFAVGPRQFFWRRLSSATLRLRSLVLTFPMVLPTRARELPPFAPGWLFHCAFGVMLSNQNRPNPVSRDNDGQGRRCPVTPLPIDHHFTFAGRRVSLLTFDTDVMRPIEYRGEGTIEPWMYSAAWVYLLVGFLLVIALRFQPPVGQKLGLFLIPNLCREFVSFSIGAILIWPFFWWLERILKSRHE